MDMINRGVLSPEHIKTFVLDEADEMLSLGFKDQIYDIYTTLPRDAQVGLFSATMPKEALEMTQRFMNNPVEILVKKDELTLEGILFLFPFHFLSIYLVLFSFLINN